jgi:hypothetical protein
VSRPWGTESPPSGRLDLDRVLDRWTADGVITSEQAARMREYDVDGLSAAPSGRTSVVVEALGYLGGATVVSGTLLVSAQYWDDLSTLWRLIVLAVSSLVLLAAAWAVPDSLEAVGARLRSVLCLASTVAVCGLLAVAALDALELDARGAPLLIGSGTATYAVVLWRWTRTPLQHGAALVVLAISTSALVNFLDVSRDLVGLGAWATGVVWALLGWGGLLTPRRLALVLGSAAAVLGAMLTAGSDPGMLLAVATVIAVCGTAVALRDLALLVVGAVGALWTTPAAMTKWFPDSVVAAYALLLVGALLVALAVRTARRSPPHTAMPAGRWSAGSPSIAVTLAVVVVLAVTFVVLAVSWW